MNLTKLLFLFTLKFGLMRRQASREAFLMYTYLFNLTCISILDFLIQERLEQEFPDWSKVKCRSSCDKVCINSPVRVAMPYIYSIHFCE